VSSTFVVPISGSGYDLCVNNVGEGTCDTLQALGATDEQLALVGSGTVDPVTMMNEVASGTNSAGAIAPPVVPASSASDIVLGSLGSAGTAVSNATSGFVATITNALSGLGQYAIWIVVGIIALILVALFVFGKSGGHIG
jgi:hypothetical protein